MPGKGQQGLACAFCEPAELDGHTLNGEVLVSGETGTPQLASAAAWFDCRLRQVYELGDHAGFVGEVVAAGLEQMPGGRPDAVKLTLSDPGDQVFYGG